MIYSRELVEAGLLLETGLFAPKNWWLLLETYFEDDHGSSDMDFPRIDTGLLPVLYLGSARVRKSAKMKLSCER
jgi:hypothetical protein